MNVSAFWQRVNSKKDVRMKIFLVDDHAILLDGIKSILLKDDSLHVVGEASSAEAALEFLKKNEIDLLITDFNLPEMDGLSLIRLVKKLSPKIKIIMLSMHDETHLVKEILKQGIDGYILKKDSHVELLEAISAVRNGKVFLSNEISKMMIHSLQFPDEERLLTDREREILKLISKEYNNKQIAEELFISERTVETHRKNIFRKTKTNNLVGLIKFAYANNLI